LTSAVSGLCRTPYRPAAAFVPWPTENQMPVPKRKTSHSKRNKRRAHDALTAPALAACPECGEMTQRHRACPHCGTYRGRRVVEIQE